MLPTLYLLAFKNDIALRPGLPTFVDLVVSTGGLICLLVIAWRVIGSVLVVVAGVFLMYVFFR